MKEYEYIVLATNEILSHLISSAICLENYFNESIDDSFKHVFSYFNELRLDYKNNVSKKSGDIEDESLSVARATARCRYKREEILESYIKELELIDPSINFKEETLKYYKDIEAEDVETLEMQLMIYPYLLSLIRNNEESTVS